MVASLGTKNDQLTAYIAKEGLVRLCTEDYERPK